MTDKKIEALKLALDAIEKLWNNIDDIDTYGDMAKADEKLYRSLVERRQRTRFEETGISTDGHTLNGGAITAIREALAEQPYAQTAAYIESATNGRMHVDPVTGDVSIGKKQPSQQQEHVIDCPRCGHCCPQPAQPSKTWVGLTDEDILRTKGQFKGTLDVQFDKFAYAIEAKLREKNK